MENYSLADIAAASGTENGFAGGSAWVLIILFALIFGNGGFFGGNQGQAASTADLQRAVDLNSIQTGQANIAADIQRTAYEGIGATKDASYNNLSEIRDLQASVAAGFANQQSCCCELKQTVMENRYLDAQNTAAIQATSSANTQKILDAISANRMADMQNQINQLQLQNAVSGVVRYPSASTYYAGANPFCGNGGCTSNI